MSELVQLRARPKAAETSTDAPASARLAYVETYGCQMNVADTEMVLGLLHASGYARTDDPARAELILINTCAVREKAEERVFARASELAQHDAILGITGCMAEHLKGAIRERAPYVDLVIGPDGYRRLVAHVEEARAGRAVDDTKLDRHETYEGLDPARDQSAAGGVTGHITIQRGCDKFCTFCVVPYTRGRERGTPPREVLRQARAMAAAGYKEVQLLGQTVNSYRHEDVGFGDLLRAVATVDGIERIRFMSPYPLDFSANVISAMAETPKVCQHVHLPLQSASDAVLGRMKRGYDFATYRALVGALRAAMPNLAITTDVMVGFCDETEDEHAETMRALDELRFDGAFTFAYSEREGTAAARKMPDTVPDAVKSRRLAEVIAAQQRISAGIYAAQVGKRTRVLVEHVSKRRADEMLTRTAEFRPVIVPAGPGVEPGAFVDVAVTRATNVTLFGTPV
ncbi:MAG TPA: tRNA (N6-isopentenyl adenosine(37)-C2)-methylthiotransferase MiaB [Polyangia bacterium]|nr:tRNA (N6-isopentenyl adenosine(37)-C2)-methylthiotransferase MiaB [Polyangia bacterium]